MAARLKSSRRASGRTVTVYRPELRFGAGPFEALGALASELFAFRSHIKLLFSSEFRASYQNTALGVLWNFVLPVVSITIYIMLVTFRVFPRLDGLAPAVYISFNVTLWGLLTGVITQPISVISSQHSSLLKTSIPLSAAIAASFATLTFETLVRIAFVACIVAWTASWPSLYAPWALLVVLDAVIFALGLGLSLSMVNAVYPDTGRVVAIVLQYGIFLSGVIFPLSSMPKLSFLETANPLSVFIHAAREVTFVGTLPNAGPFVAWSAVGFALLLFSVRFFYIMEYRLRGTS